MAEPAFYANPRRAAEVTREHQKLSQLIADHEAHQRLEREIAEARAFGRDANADPDLRELAARASIPAEDQPEPEAERPRMYA